ncbi:acyltransferase family protein [Cupriavidus necator]
MNNEIRSLTGLRGIAALYVVSYHLHPTAGDGLIPTFFRHGYLAVDLFFVLSGFVMALNYGSIFRDGFTTSAYRAFLIKRIARVYPLYLFVTTCTAAIALLGGTTHIFDGPFPAIFTANVLMIQAWGIAPSIAHSAWSISTEWAAFLIFPLLVSILLYGRKAYASLGLISCLAGIIAVSLINSPLILGSQSLRNGPLDLCTFDSIGPLVRCIAGFSLGLLAYRLRSITRVQEILGSPPIAVTIGIAVLAATCIPRTDILLVMLYPPLIISLSLQRGLFAQVLSTRAIYTLGIWSYSIYLMHGPFSILQRVLAEGLARYSIPGAEITSTIVTSAIVVALSAIAYKAIEKPSRYLVQTLFRPRERSTEPSGNVIS